MPRISVIEFGVAGGRGLIALESIAAEIAQYSGVAISVFGFDVGEGLPRPVDYRDLPHVFGQGDYRMDFDPLRKRLKSAKLILGDVAETVPSFLAREFDPIGFISFDLDYYSSTMAAFAIFDGESLTRLPRIYSFFDDVIWPEDACHNDHVGELLAINEGGYLLDSG